MTEITATRSRSSATNRRGDDGLQARPRETGGDIERAIKLLREKGLAPAAKRAGRETTEGKVVFDRLGENVGAMVAVGCETEPVSKNDEFLVFAERVLDVVERTARAPSRSSRKSGRS